MSSTVTETVSAVETRPPVSVTVRLKVNFVSAFTVGAVKVGEAAAALDSVTAGVPIWVQA